MERSGPPLGHANGDFKISQHVSTKQLAWCHQGPLDIPPRENCGKGPAQLPSHRIVQKDSAIRGGSELVGNVGEDASSLISWSESSLIQQRLLAIVRSSRSSICNSHAQIYRQGFSWDSSAASNASKVQCNVCTAWVLLWLTCRYICHAAL